MLDICGNSLSHYLSPPLPSAYSHTQFFKHSNIEDLPCKISPNGNNNNRKFVGIMESIFIAILIYTIHAC